MNKAHSFLVVICLFCLQLHSQSIDLTVGVISHAGQDKVQEGYNLFYPHNQPDVFLLDNCGRIVHKWDETGVFVPGNTAYLLEDGKLLKTKRALSSGPNNPIFAGGAGETIELRSWENELLASYTLNTDKYRLHHDISPLPNGNVLAIAWEAFTYDEAVAAGRDTALLPDSVVWAEAILEIDLLADSIVWEWHAWDHLVQDYDFNKANFGDIDQNPQLINLNYVIQGGAPDWLHFNSIDYNPRRNHILISVPHFDEIWIIDHATTTEQAAGAAGDLLYRWGNPRAFQAGTVANQQLFFEHDAAWIDDHLPESDPYFGLISVFNNRVPGGVSTVNVIDPGFNETTSTYPRPNGSFLPEEFTLTIQHPINPDLMVSASLSGAQRLPNGNFLITSGRRGYTFEINPISNEIVWEYSNAIIGGNRIEQGTDVSILNRLYFRMARYPQDFSGLAGRDLTPGEYLELEPDEALCNSVTSIANWLPAEELPSLYPNPTSEQLTIDWPNQPQGHFTAVDLFGRVVYQTFLLPGNTRQRLNTSNWPAGVYVLYLNAQTIGKVIVK